MTPVARQKTLHSIPKTIVFVAGRFGLDGVSRWEVELIGGLDRSRWRPILIFLERFNREPLGEMLGHLRCEILIAKGGGGIRDPRRILGLLWEILWLKPSIVICSNRQVDSTLRVFCKLSGLPHVTIQHSVFSAYTRLIRIAETITLRLSSAVVAVSHCVAESYGPAEFPAVQVIQHGVRRPIPKRAVGEIRASLGIGEAELVFLCVGRLHDRVKNQSGLIKGFGRYRAQGGTGVLIVLGSGGDEDFLRSLIVSLGLSGIVFLMPADGDVGSYFQDADMYIQPSRWEGFGLTLAEAMSHRLPIVATRIAAFEELLQGVPVIWIRGIDERGIAEALHAARAIPDSDRKKMGEISFERHKGAFSVDTMVRQYEELFEGVLCP